jgi:hypothetical protein
MYYPFQPAAEWASLLSPIRDLRLGWLNKATFAPLYQLRWRQNRVLGAEPA